MRKGQFLSSVPLVSLPIAQNSNELTTILAVAQRDCNMYGVKVMREVGALLYWSMLAACTVGPGTVVTCARAGAEYGLQLSWSLLVASILAYVMLEASARLTIVSGLSLGQCLQIKYQHGRTFYGTAIKKGKTIIVNFNLSQFFNNSRVATFPAISTQIPSS